VEGFISGLHKSPYHGFSVEFAEHNLYNPGESTKNIDWKVYARTDRLYTKKFEEETNLRAWMLIDHSASMYYPDGIGKLRFACYAAASLGYLVQRQRDAVGLATFEDEISFVSDSKSTRAHLLNLQVQLQKLMNTSKPSGETNIGYALNTLATQLSKRALIVLFTDFIEKEDNLKEVFHGLQNMKHQGHEIILFHLYDKKTELDLDLPDKSFVFVDPETGLKEKVDVARVRDSFRAKMAAFQQELKIMAGTYKMDYVNVDINQSVNHVLRSYLIKRSKML
jgi:uncharacterized protein (DUF58 family)